jgi:hypothetical protein
MHAEAAKVIDLDGYRRKKATSTTPMNAVCFVWCPLPVWYWVPMWQR